MCQVGFLVWGDCAAITHARSWKMPQDGKPSQVSLLISVVTSNKQQLRLTLTEHDGTLIDRRIADVELNIFITEIRARKPQHEIPVCAHCPALTVFSSLNGVQ